MIHPTSERLSLIFLWISSAALVLLPAATGAALILNGGPGALLGANLSPVPISPSLPESRAWFALGVGFFAAIALYVALWQARRLFALGRDGRSLTPAAALAIHRIGIALLAAAALAVLARPIQSLILTSANAPGERALAISLSSADLGLLLAGGLMMMIGAVLKSAVAIAEDQARIV